MAVYDAWRVVPLALGLLLPAPGLAAERVPPAPHCLDARTVQEVFQADERNLAVAAAGGKRYRVELQGACPVSSADGGARMLAEAGWMCGTGNEYIAVGDALCPVTGVAGIDAAEYAAHARASHTSADGTVTLSTVTVKGERRRGFAASASYCLNPRHMRGWSEDPEGLVVEVNPRRSGGNRYYRVELSRSCPQLAGGGAIALQSRLGIGVVCGNPGDTVRSGTRMGDLVGGSPVSMGVGQQPLMLSDGRPPGFMQTGSDRLQNLGARFGCPISAVYPIGG